MRLLLIFLAVSTLSLNAQEMESDLYASLNNSSLSAFMKTAYSTMNVITYRTSQNLGLVEEHTTTYRKGKINPERVNFTINYTEYFILDDRKKSLGRYDLNANSEISRYERTDFNQRNVRTYTYYHYYTYHRSVLVRELIRTKEYIGTGSVEMDTVVTVDSVNYEVTDTETGIRQKDLSAGGSVSDYLIENNRLSKEISRLTGFSEENNFIYDGSGRLVTIENVLIGEDGQRIRSYTNILYSIEGLITEAVFYDQNNEVLEKKIFTYK